jgi:hypothetical protein
MLCTDYYHLIATLTLLLDRRIITLRDQIKLQRWSTRCILRTDAQNNLTGEVTFSNCGKLTVLLQRKDSLQRETDVTEYTLAHDSHEPIVPMQFHMSEPGYPHKQMAPAHIHMAERVSLH